MEPADEREVEIFEAALERPEGRERDAYLDQACAGDQVLRARLNVLLQAHENPDSVLEPQVVARDAATVCLPSEEGPGTTIGRYKLREQIGEGGYGIVYLAEQEQPVRRRVALKVIKLGMDTKQVVARFEAERQALAMMDHPNIARVLDAGATDTGRLYFVMELVRGTKITDYCDQNHLSTDERLKLFVQVCHAVQHAHQKGVIHRDLKPSNILVMVADDVPVPKVIDFGIAKAIGERLTDKTVYTQFQQFIGTPAYMSPEQAGVSGLDLDTRSDIYALGVLLYELLTGRTPFEPKELAQAGLVEMLRCIREVEPPKPSTRLSRLEHHEQTTTAQRQATEAPKLIRSLRGDLDWIVMRCLEKNRTRRYETANALAQDILHHLANEPVTARPPSRAYRFQKLVRRNRLAFAAAGAVTAALVIGLGLSTWLFFREQQARRSAVRAEQAQRQSRQEAEANAQKAQSEARKSEQIALFLKDMLKGVGPSVARGRDTTMLREILDKTAVRVGTELKDSPQVEAELRTTIGEVYEALHQLPKAEGMYRAALPLNKSLYGELSTNAADCLERIGVTLTWQDKPRQAEPLLLKALKILTNSLGSEHPEVARALGALGDARRQASRFNEAEALYLQSLAMEERLGMRESQNTAFHLEGLAVALLAQGKPQEAEAAARKALAIQTKLVGGQEPDAEFGMAQGYLGEILAWQGKLDEAETNARSAVGILKQLLGPDNVMVADGSVALADVLERQGKLPEAEQAGREALRVFRKQHAANPRPSNVAGSFETLVRVLTKEGKLAEAEGLVREAITTATKLWPSDPAIWRFCFYRLVDVLYRQEKRPDGYRALSEALTPELAGPSQDPVLLEIRANLSGRAGKWKEAAADYARLVEITPTDPWWPFQYGAVLLVRGDLEAYRQLCRRVLARAGSTNDSRACGLIAKGCFFLPPAEADLPTLGQLVTTFAATATPTAWTQSTQALAEYRQGRFDAAVHWAQKALDPAGEVIERDALAYSVLAMAQHRLNHATEARAALAKAVELTRTGLPQLGSGDLGQSWWDLVIAHIILREAKALIESETATANPPKP